MSAREVVAVIDPMAACGVEDLRRRFEVAYLPDLDPAERSPRLGAASAVVVRTTRIDAAALAAMPHLRAIVKHGAGVDNIDVEAATRAGIAVLSTPAVGAAAVAEHAVMLALMVCRRALELHAAVLDGRFGVRDAWRLVELDGKRVGIVGFGNIGRRVARIYRHGFGADVVAFDPFAAPAEEAGIVVAESLDELLAEVDVVSVHAALTGSSRHLIGAPELARMRPHAVLVNTARGGVVDEAALLEALRAGRLGGAGLDVFESEPPDPEDALLRVPNVVVSPHIAGLTAEAADRLSTASAAAVTAILGGEREPTGLLNPEYLTSAGAAPGG